MLVVLHCKKAPEIQLPLICHNYVLSSIVIVDYQCVVCHSHTGLWGNDRAGGQVTWSWADAETSYTNVVRLCSQQVTNYLVWQIYSVVLWEMCTHIELQYIVMYVCMHVRMLVASKLFVAKTNMVSLNHGYVIKLIVIEFSKGICHWIHCTYHQWKQKV